MCFPFVTVATTSTNGHVLSLNLTCLRAAPLSEDPISKVRVLDIPEHSRGVVCQSLTLAIPDETRGAILQDSTHAEPEATRGADCQNPTLEYRHRADKQFPEVGQPWDVKLNPNLDVITRGLP